MLTPRFVRVGSFATVFACLILTVIAGQEVESKRPVLVSRQDLRGRPGVTVDAAGPVVQSTFYTVRPDVRRCASPLCGGYFVKRVNQALTRCANGRWSRECYVAEIVWNGSTQVEPRRALLRGNIIAKRFAPFGNLGS